MEERLALASLCAATYGWTMQNACLAVNVFLERFWRVKQLLRDHDESQCLPSPVMDRVWCLATCFTREYRLLCGAGPLFEHRPLALHAGPTVASRYRRTLKTLAQLFPDEPLDPTLFPAASAGAAAAPQEGEGRKRAADNAAAEDSESERRVRGRPEEGQGERMQVFVRGERTYCLDVLPG
jgi:hypothetical protein